VQQELQRTMRNMMYEKKVKAVQEQDARLKAIEDEQSGFVAELDRWLGRKDEENKLRCRDQVNLWTAQVYSKIESQIAKVLEETDRKALSNRLNKLYNDYVATVNGKTVFLDIIIESEYNPFEAKQSVIKYDATPHSREHPEGMVDPLCEQIDKVLERHEGKLHELQGGGRSIIPVNEWNTVSQTPIGFAARDYANSLKPPDPNANEKGRVKRGISKHVTATMDQFGYPRGAEGSLIARLEAPPGKKCFPGWAPKGQTETKWKPPFALDKIEAAADDDALG